MDDESTDREFRRAVFIVTPTFLPVSGGAEVGIHELATRIAQWADVTVVAPSEPLLAASAEEWIDFKSRPLPYAVVNYSNVFMRLKPGVLRSALVALLIPELLTLLRIGAGRRGAVWNIHFVKPFGFLAFWGRYVMRVRVVVSLVGRSDVYADNSILQKFMLNLVGSFAHQIIQNSSFYLNGSSLVKRAVTIPYGVDLTSFNSTRRSETVRKALGAGPNDTLLLAVQRVAPVKRVDLLVEVANILQGLTNGRGGSYRLAVVGVGSELASVKALATRLEAKNVHFAGFVDDAQMGAIFASSDVFVSHSLYETFGVTFAQAMAAGVPIVAAKTSCIPLVVEDGVNGSLVTPYDIPAFATAVQRVGDDSLALSYSASNAAKARSRFDWDLIAEATYEVFEPSQGCGGV